jgi:hypothetical protein
MKGNVMFSTEKEREINWEKGKLPLTVGYSIGVPIFYEEAVWEAMNYLNTVTGIQIFKEELVPFSFGQRRRADIILQIHPKEYEEIFRALTIRRCTSFGRKMIFANISFRRSLDNWDHLKKIAIHELCHAIGLEHNTEPSSLMNPFIKTDMMDEHELIDSDIQLLVSTYKDVE